MIRKYLLTILTLPALILSSLSANYVKTIFAQENCSAVLDLDRTLNNNQAEVTNNSYACEYTVTLALYDSPQEPETIGWIEAQTLIGSDTKKIKPGEKVSFFIEDTGQACVRQADLFEGSNVLSVPHYENNLATSVYHVPCLTPSVPSTPTPSLTPLPTQTPTTTPVPTTTPIPGPTDTPAPGPTNTPAPGPSSTPTPGTPGTVLALTGNTTFIYAVILAGAISLIAGLILRKFSK